MEYKKWSELTDAEKKEWREQIRKGRTFQQTDEPKTETAGEIFIQEMRKLKSWNADRETEAYFKKSWDEKFK